MPAPPTDPAAPQADDVPQWLYRSEGFAEDLDDALDDGGTEPADRNAPGRE